LHERVVLLTVIIREVPWVNPSERLEIQTLPHGFYRVIVYFGFMDRPDVSQALGLCTQRGLALEPLQTWFLLSRATVIPTPRKGMAPWRERLFAAMARNARTAGDYFNLPAGQVVELGTKIEI
jgi:KUP system potassium uptake protein